MQRGNLTYDQVSSADRHGTQADFQMSDGTGIEGNIPIFNADGSLTDGGYSLNSIISVNGDATIEVNGVAVSFDDIVTINGA